MLKWQHLAVTLPERRVQWLLDQCWETGVAVSVVRSEKPSGWRWGTIFYAGRSPILCHWCIQFSACKIANISSVNLSILILPFFPLDFLCLYPAYIFPLLGLEYWQVNTHTQTHTQAHTHTCTHRQTMIFVHSFLSTLIMSVFIFLSASSCHLRKQGWNTCFAHRFVIFHPHNYNITKSRNSKELLPLLLTFCGCVRVTTAAVTAYVME